MPSILKPQKYVSSSSKKYKKARYAIRRLIKVTYWDRKRPNVYAIVTRLLLRTHREFHLNYPNNFLRENRTDQNARVHIETPKIRIIEQ